MKKILPFIAIAIIVLIGRGTMFLLKKDKNSGGSDSQQVTTTKTDSTSKYSDACKLFTQAAVGSALGGSFEAGQGSSQPSASYNADRGSSCSYEQVNDGTTAGMVASITFAASISNMKDVAEAKSFMNGLRNPQTAEGKAAVNSTTNVDDAGDEAFIVTLNVSDSVSSKTQQLYIRDGSQIVNLSATRLAGIEDSTKTGLQTLAKEL